jgi:hypothetical protein
MGTPGKNWHRLAPSASESIGKAFSDLVNEENHQLLEYIQSHFSAMVQEQREAGRALRVTSFFEMSGLGEATVSKENAARGHYMHGIEADHVGIARLPGEDEQLFGLLSSLLLGRV